MGNSGGKRLGAGRKPGVLQGPKASTISKAEAREGHRQVIAKYAYKMIQSQVASAIGIGHVFTRDEHGKFSRITDEAHALRLLTEGTEGKDFYIFMKDPSTAAFTDLMNRAFDKPKEQEQEVNLHGAFTIKWEDTK